MQYRNVGGSGLKVSEIALGSWMTRLEDAAAVDIAMDIAHKAFDAGVRISLTAPTLIPEAMRKCSLAGSSKICLAKTW